MDEFTKNIKKNTGILLARNNPVALVVGASGFLGSHIADKLLSKNIQVVGVIEDGYGKKENLSNATGNKNFHQITDYSLESDLGLERLDYLIIVPHRNFQISKTLKLFKEYKCRLLLISSVVLYSEKNNQNLRWLKLIESEVARSAQDDHLNARILRLGSVYGARMDFNKEFGELDPVAYLIAQSLKGELQREISLEFSSRALYIDDAVNLAVKCIFAGATAQKIFDGVLSSPIKVSEIKQVLLDPLWHENRDFIPQELPPWPTPNLERTINFLNWHPGSKLVENLRKTLAYFKDNEIEIPEVADREVKEEDGKAEEEKWKEEKQKD